MSDYSEVLQRPEFSKTPKVFRRREQAAVTIGRETNLDFINFKTKFLENIEILRERLLAAYRNESINGDELYDMTMSILSGTQTKVDIIVYLNAIYSSEYFVVEHCMRVGLLANIFANWMGFSEEETKTATVAGFLHDFGMMEVPKQIIEKKGKLTEKEKEVVDGHVIRGALLLAGKGVNQDVLEAIQSHHERYDGSGYPAVKKGEEIGSCAALISIADVYDSMTSNRPYRPAVCPFEVIEHFEKYMIGKFNPGFLYVFLENIPHIYRNSLVMLSNGETARVMFVNKHNKTLPIVKIENEERFIDLSTNRDIKILRLL